MSTLILAGWVRRTPPLRKLTAFFATLFEGIREGHELRTRYEALWNLTNEELAQRGLSREDVARVAATGTKLV